MKEGDSGTTNAVFRLRLSCAAAARVAPLRHLDGTALAGNDYIATKARCFPAGTTNATVTVLSMAIWRLSPTRSSSFFSPLQMRLCWATRRPRASFSTTIAAAFPTARSRASQSSTRRFRTTGPATNRHLSGHAEFRLPRVSLCSIRHDQRNGHRRPRLHRHRGSPLFPPGTTNGVIVVQILPKPATRQRVFLRGVPNPTNATALKRHRRCDDYQPVCHQRA